MQGKIERVMLSTINNIVQLNHSMIHSHTMQQPQLLHCGDIVSVGTLSIVPQFLWDTFNCTSVSKSHTPDVSRLCLLQFNPTKPFIA